MSFDFKLPDLGEGIQEAEILAVKVTEGQEIKEDQILFEVETDKAVVEIPSPASGKVTKVYVVNGQSVTVGSIMVSIQESGASNAAPTVSKSVSVPLEKASSVPSTTSATDTPTTTHTTSITSKPSQYKNIAVATPATRRLARELKIDINLIHGTGAGGRILKEDVIAFSEAKQSISSKKVTTGSDTSTSALSSAAILPDFSKFGSIERIPVRSLRRKTAQLMSLSWEKIPHVTHCDEADVTSLEDFRKKIDPEFRQRGGKFTLTVLILKAVALALQEFPQFNASFDEQAGEIILKHYYHIGMAAATERGLIVPVVRSVNEKSLLQLAIEIPAIVEKARLGKTELQELQGGSFTVTNIGAIGGTNANPIINYPEAAILAVLKVKEKPIVKNDRLEKGLIMPLSLAFDHRIADGAEAANFVNAIIKALENPSLFEKHLGL